MKVATIVPQNYLGLTKNDDYFMCLGNLIGAPGMEAYTEFFKQRCAEGKFVIMDNGLIEGDPRPIAELARKAMDLGVSEMVMTDVFCDKDKTLAAIDKGVNELRPIEHPKLMLVPQGSTIEEWVECAHELILRYRFEFTLGIPKVLVKLGGRDGRALALTELMERCPVAAHKECHLLGCWTTPLELTVIDKLSKQGHFPPIRGVDSAMPFVYARAGKKLNSQDRPDSVPINFEKTCVNPFLLRYNVYQWRRAADVSRRFL
ncbi:MAG: hypothetical protein RR382_00845 [Tannerellaceae bacterium]